MNLTMIGRLDPCFLLSYAIDPWQARKFVPAELDLITFSGYAFLNIVVCRVDRIRPRLAPRRVGFTYWHIAYRIHVRATFANELRVEGLFFLRSDVDRTFISVVGNRFADFRFHCARIHFSEQGAESFVEVRGVDDHRADAVVRVSPLKSEDSVLSSPFASIEERERVLKYPPLSMAVLESGEYVRLAEVTRDEAAWREEWVGVEQAEWAYLRSLGLEHPRLVRAARVMAIDYRWCLGRTERLSAGRGSVSQRLLGHKS